MPNYRSYVICTSPRSGSTLLCKLLADSGVAGNPDSWFHKPSLSAWIDHYDLAIDSSHSEQAALKAVFNAAINAGTSGRGLFGLRMQRHSFEFFCQKLCLLYPNTSSDLQRFESAFGPTLFVHLTRRSKIEQAVSYVIASQSGLWHRAIDGSELERLSPPKEPVYDVYEIREKVAELTVYDREWEHWFATENINPLQITYESLADDPIEVLRQILGALGLSTDAANKVSIAVAKLANAKNKVWVARYQSDNPGRGST